MKLTSECDLALLVVEAVSASDMHVAPILAVL
jgi:hypothetical protein